MAGGRAKGDSKAGGRAGEEKWDGEDERERKGWEPQAERKL